MNEILNPPWAKVMAYAQDELTSARAKLEKPGATRDEDMVVKGEIRALKRLLDLPARLQAAAQQSQIAPLGFTSGDES